MKRKRRYRCFVCALLCIAALLCGCRLGNRDIVVSGITGSKYVFRIDGASCSIREAMVYLTNYQNIYGTSCGVDLWQHDFGDDSLSQYIKDITMEELTQVYCMNLLAGEREMELSEEEVKSVSDAAREYYGTLSTEEIVYLGVSEADIREYYSHYALAGKLYHSLTDGVNAEVSDDEARIMEIMQIFVSDSGKAAEVRAKLDNGDDFASVANNYNELPVIQTTISRDDVAAEVEQVAFSLDNDEISGMISVENGYYFIKCLNKYDVELTEANKSNIVEKREKEAFDDVYNEFVSSRSSWLNRELWNGVVPDTGGEMKTDRFFEVFAKYCGDI